jgi:hypothetical protein
VHGVEGRRVRPAPVHGDVVGGGDRSGPAPSLPSGSELRGQRRESPGRQTKR